MKLAFSFLLSAVATVVVANDAEKPETSDASWIDAAEAAMPVGADGACPMLPHPESPLTVADYPDPPVVLDHEIHIWGRDDSKSKIYLPSKDGNVAPGRFPLVILLHGRTYEYDEYTRIQQRLAENGIASVSVQYSESHKDSDYVDTQFYEVFERTLQSIYLDTDPDSSPLHGKVTYDIAIVGHSMGGGLGVYAANRLIQEAKYGLTVRSVMGLAPNPNADADWYLRPEVTRGFLGLFGADDADNGVNTPGNSSFYLYDRSGHLQNEFTNVFPKQAFVKSMVYMADTDHDDFTDSGFEPRLATAAGYVVAFARWSLRNDGAYAVHFRQQVPLGDNTTVSTLYSAPYRRVLENFEDKDLSHNALGGKNTFSNLTVEQDFSAFEKGSPHFTDIARLDWNAGKGLPIARFGIPMPIKGLVDMQDLSKFRYLSFRAGQMYERAINSGNFDFRIRLHYFANGTHASQAIRLSDVGNIPFPLAYKRASETKSVMNTVVVPLCRYDTIDFHRASITGVSFEFAQPGSESGEIQIDSIEFVP